MKRESIQILTQSLPVHHREGPGKKKFPYYKYEDVVARMNLAFEHDWSSEVLNSKDVGEEIIVLVRVIVGNNYHDQVGRSSIKRISYGDKKGELVSYGNDYKSAIADGIKKCAELFGVGFSEGSEEYPISSQEALPPPAPKMKDVSRSPNPVIAPVSQSITVSTSRKETTEVPSVSTNVDIEAIKKFVAQYGDGSPSLVREDTAKVPKKEVLEETEKPVEFPTRAGDEKVTDMQRGALMSLCKPQGLSEEMCLSEALPGIGKSEFKELTKDEAKTVIRFLQKRRSSIAG